MARCYAASLCNIVGRDIGKTGGFAVFSVNGGWRPKQGILIAAGVDNLFDKTYAEHISRGGAMLAGFEQTTRVNEPGRMLWMKGHWISKDEYGALEISRAVYR